MSFKQEALEALGVYRRNTVKALGEKDENVRVIDTCIQLIDEIEEKEGQKTFMVIDNTTGKEADPYEIALHEDWAKNLIYSDMEGFMVKEDGTLLLVDECGRHVYCSPERFKVIWDE